MHKRCPTDDGAGYRMDLWQALCGTGPAQVSGLLCG